jgi:hypothetical protein
MSLSSFVSSFVGVGRVALGRMGVLGCLLVMASFVVLGCFTVMAGCVGMMLRSLPVAQDLYGEARERAPDATVAATMSGAQLIERRATPARSGASPPRGNIGQGGSRSCALCQ